MYKKYQVSMVNVCAICGSPTNQPIIGWFVGLPSIRDLVRMVYSQKCVNTNLSIKTAIIMELNVPVIPREAKMIKMLKQ